MRIRRKRWAPQELKDAPFCVEDPPRLQGCWRTRFARPHQPLHIELGCGKGGFISQAGPLYQDVNFLAIDLIDSMLGVCKRAVEASYQQAESAVDNLLLAAWDIEHIDKLLAPQDAVQRVYIHFCNPWPKERHKKHRLTHTRQLAQYRAFMAPGALLCIKTDDEGLFLDTHDYLAQAGFTVLHESRDLHRGPLHLAECGLLTEHERMFIARGIPIQCIVAQNV